MAQKILYYADGYHGGIRGHMPLGCWRDILSQLRDRPDWKLSIDVEPISWDFLKQRDPAAYDELRELLRDDSIASRLEMVSGSYAQPYGWITDGESNIRHLTLGLKELKRHFPWLTVDTYAVQEPCWTSALPQMLVSLGFKRAVLKDPSTAWGGYSAGRDAEVCWWQGPDGTRIPLVPRYECEELVNAWETESCYGERAFAEKCIAHGIEHPAGMYYQDLGWPARPRLADMPGHEGRSAPDYARYVTWKQYFEQVAGPPAGAWRVSQEDFRGALPWGERVLVRMARQVRRGEAEMLLAERLCALAYLAGGADRGDRLEEAWGHLLMTQHHDGWICAGAGRGEHNWAWKTSAQIYAMEALTGRATAEAMADLAQAACPIRQPAGDAETLVAFNPLGRAEERLIAAPITSAPGTRSFRVYDGDRRLPSQCVPNRTYADGSVNAGTLLFRAPLPGLGVRAFRVEPDAAPEQPVDRVAAGVERGLAWLETPYYRVEFDLDQGGVIRSLVDKRRGAQLVDANAERGFNEYYGYFVDAGRYCSSREHPADAEVVANGPVSASLLLRGRVGDAAYRQWVSLSDGDAAIGVRVAFEFPEKTHIGEPHEIDPAFAREERHRSHHDGRHKLNAYFPTAFEQGALYKDAAYDVCRSELADTHFKRWDEIKHNILVGWVDVTDGVQGLAILCDHTTSYIHGGGCPLGLTLAWGWDGGFWWGRRQLKGEHALCYHILPHAGDWRAADLWHEHQKVLLPPRCQRAVGRPAAMRHIEALSILGGPAELSAALLDEEKRLIVRLFNPGAATRARLSLGADDAGLVEQVTLGGQPIARLERKLIGENRALVELDMPEFGIATLRITR
ncbi:MAG: hypothetical protein GX558_01950 [Clostridiales bacterium]|nr:hypothetical protein [Clostridiales bacterium]